MCLMWLCVSFTVCHVNYSRLLPCSYWLFIRPPLSLIIAAVTFHNCCSFASCRHCLICLFMMRHTFLIGDRSGLQADQSSTHTLCLRSHAVVTRAEWGLVLSCWNRHGVPGKSRHLDGSICLMHKTISGCISLCSGRLLSHTFRRWWLDGHAHSAAVSTLGLHTPRFPLTSWILSRYYELWWWPKL